MPASGILRGVETKRSESVCNRFGTQKKTCVFTV